MLKISSALAAAFSLSAITGKNAFVATPREGEKRKAISHSIKPRRKRAGRVSARGHHNHAAYLKRERKRRIKKAQKYEVRRPCPTWLTDWIDGKPGAASQ